MKQSNRRHSRMFKANLRKKWHEIRYIKYNHDMSCLCNPIEDNQLKYLKVLSEQRPIKDCHNPTKWSNILQRNSLAICLSVLDHFVMFAPKELIPAVFYTVKISIFQYSFCCNICIRCDTIAFRGAFRTSSNIQDRVFCKLSYHFLSVNYFRNKTSISDI